VRRKDIFKPTTGNESLHEASNDNGIGKITVNHNNLHVLILFFYMSWLRYRAIIRQKGTKETFLCKIPYLFYNIYVHVESSTYISQKMCDEPKLLITKCVCRIIAC
jgi:hypothetical protein